MSENSPLKTIKTNDGKEHKIATEVSVRNKKYIITIDRNVLIQDENGSFVACRNDDEDAQAIFEMLKPAKSLDVEDEAR